MRIFTKHFLNKYLDNYYLFFKHLYFSEPFTGDEELLSPINHEKLLRNTEFSLKHYKRLAIFVHYYKISGYTQDSILDYGVPFGLASILYAIDFEGFEYRKNKPYAAWFESLMRMLYTREFMSDNCFTDVSIVGKFVPMFQLTEQEAFVLSLMRAYNGVDTLFYPDHNKNYLKFADMYMVCLLFQRYETDESKKERLLLINDLFDNIKEIKKLAKKPPNEGFSVVMTQEKGLLTKNILLYRLPYDDRMWVIIRDVAYGMVAMAFKRNLKLDTSWVFYPPNKLEELHEILRFAKNETTHAIERLKAQT